MTVELGLDLRTDLPVATPQADTPSGWVTMGIADTLDLAAEHALNAMYDLMQRRYRLGRAETIALASVVVDLRVTQIVNEVVGVHAVLPHVHVRVHVPSWQPRSSSALGAVRASPAVSAGSDSGGRERGWLRWLQGAVS